MKRKLIHIEQNFLVECDTPSCDYSEPNETKDPNTDTYYLINAPCPKCGGNLLTEKDYYQYMKFMSRVNWVNKWFGWLGPKRVDYSNGTVSVKVHNGIKISE